MALHSSFAAEFEEWFLASGAKKTRLEKKLRQTYRSAWASGDVDDRFLVVSFIFWNREADGYDLILRGLTDPIDHLAQHAACNALALITCNEHLGGGLREALEKFQRGHPDWSNVAGAALDLIAQEE